MGLSRAHRYTELETSSASEGTSFKSEEKQIKLLIALYMATFCTAYLLDVVSIFVRLLAERHGGVDPEELVEEGTC